MELVGELALIFAAIAAGGLLKGAIGAGAPILAVPVMALFFDVQLAVAVMVIPNLLSNLWQVWHYRREALPAPFLRGMALSGALGALFGSALLVTAPPDILLAAVAITVFVYIVFRLARPGWTLSYDTALRVVWPVGLAGGTMQGALGLSAPVSVSFMNAMNLERLTFLASISVYFATMSLAQVPVLWAAGILDRTAALYGVLAVVPLFGAMPVGAWLARHVSRRTFDRVVLTLLALIAARMLLKVLG